MLWDGWVAHTIAPFECPSIAVPEPPGRAFEAHHPLATSSSKARIAFPSAHRQAGSARQILGAALTGSRADLVGCRLGLAQAWPIQAVSAASVEPAAAFLADWMMSAMATAPGSMTPRAASPT
jgi:hypothetical protein